MAEEQQDAKDPRRFIWSYIEDGDPPPDPITETDDGLDLEDLQDMTAEVANGIWIEDSKFHPMTAEQKETWLTLVRECEEIRESGQPVNIGMALET